MKLLLVDASNMVMRSAFGGEIPPGPAVATAGRIIMRCCDEFDITHVIMVLDDPDSTPTWRKLLYPAYKANRTTDTSPWIRKAYEEFSDRNFMVCIAPGYEGDDVIATLAARVKGRDVFVLSGDSDLLALTAHRNVHVIKPKDGGLFELQTVAGICEKYGLGAPHDMTTMKALCGETGDNIPGVPGIGPVRAAKLIDQHIDLDGIIEAGKENACKHSTLVALHEPAARLSLQLAALCTTVPLDPIKPSFCALDARYL